MALVVISSLSKTIDQILQHDEYLLSANGKQQIASLREQVYFLLEFVEKFPHEANTLETRIRDAANEAEDIIEHFIYEQISSSGATKIQYDFHELKIVMEEINSISLQAENVRQSSGIPAKQDPTGSSSSTTKPLSDDVPVGLEEDLELMKNLVCGGSSKRRVIPITGMGGIGKTTLAGKVYHDELIRYKFPARAWVTVSQNYDTENIFTNLLASLQEVAGGGGGGHGAFGGDSTKDRVYKILMVTKYLIVLDDVWSEEAWDDIKKALPDQGKANGSRILITTRLGSVASHAAPSTPLHEMRLMDPSQSWKLIERMVFLNRECPSSLVKIGYEIAKNCGGLPLAVVLIGGILGKETETEESWEEFAKNVRSVIQKDAQFKKIMSLSYTHLPRRLRPCLLYIGGFPEGNEIRVSKLIKLWMAEGFVRGEYDKSLEEVGEEYLEDLVRRSLVFVTSRKSNGKAKGCNIHGLMRDLCQTISLDENMERRVSIAHPELRRLAKDYASTVRSVISFKPFESSLVGLRKMRLMRVLDVVDTEAYSLPLWVFELFHLRYLAFSCPMEIPVAISKLQNLRTLIIRPSKRFRRYSVDEVYLPLEIWMLPLLEHLVSFYDLLPNPEGATPALENLLTLSVVKKLICTTELMERIPNVKKLGITYFGDRYKQDYQLHNLVLLEQLEKLTLVVLKVDPFVRLVVNPVLPETLKKLTLSGWRLPWTYMEVVGSLPNLQVLKLRDHACEGYTWETEEGQFLKLEFLLIDGSYLSNWITGMRHFPRLKRLALRRCPLLSEIPNDIGDIVTLEVIEIDHGNEALVECVKHINKEQRDCGNDLLQVLCLHNEVYQSGLITDTGSHIDSLKRDLHVFKAFLKEKEKKWRKDEHAKVMLMVIQNFVYEAEDVIDAFITGAMEIRRPESLFSTFWGSRIDLDSIRAKVDAVREKVERSRIEMDVLSSDDEDELQAEIPRQGQQVGLSDMTEHLISSLTKKPDEFEVVSLIGMPGLGKTMLARLIFNDPTILYKFPIRIWLDISQKFSDKDIFLAILKELTTINEDIRRKNDNELAQTIVARLEKETFLIVMDDIWTIHDWDRLRVALPQWNEKGKVLITSRSEDVGRYASMRIPPIRLRFFTFEESWELLQMIALGGLHCPPELECVGRLIARNCIGQEFAVRVIGGVLAAKFSASDISATRKAWEQVSEGLNAYLQDESPTDSVEKVVSLSYDRLPHHLRLCFLYLGVFPENYEIQVTKLIFMWIGEGFIQPGNDQCSLEEAAEKYLEELININLIHVEKFKPNGKAKTCRIHYIVREFCLSEAANENENENENFLKEIKSHDRNFQPPVSNLYKCRWLSIHSGSLDFIASKPFGPRARSIFCFEEDAFTLPVENIPDILEAFKLVRVMDITPIKLTKISSHMYQLIHVRYMALSLSLSTLPSKFSQLRNIQTLIIETTSSTLDVKADIWKLSQLRHFKTNAPAILPKPSEENKHGAQLQTLGLISVESCTEEVFGRARNVKKLGIRGRLALLVDGKVGSIDSFAEMKCLEELKIVNDIHHSPASIGELWLLPHRIPSKLKSLTLVATLLSWDSMHILGLLENLEVLKLKDKAFMGSDWRANDEGFRSLNFLQIEETDLVYWGASSHSFPVLRRLILNKCGKLIEIPIELAEVDSFQMLELHVCRSAAASALYIKEIKDVKRNTQFKGPSFKLSISPPTE